MTHVSCYNTYRCIVHRCWKWQQRRWPKYRKITQRERGMKKSHIVFQTPKTQKEFWLALLSCYISYYYLDRPLSVIWLMANAAK